ncbi:regulation of AMPA receptor activity protein [Homalodisca vitripennis]|nr:regulation of AMPA receptor activity protein [Homalodisca vitripennis]
MIRQYEVSSQVMLCLGSMRFLHAVTRSAIFFVSASLLLLCGEFCCLCGHLARHRRLLTFVAGVIFIISGLLMLIGLVMYISVFKAEVGSKLRPRSQLQPPMFTFRYGYSFLLYVSGFMSSEAAGTCAVLLYIYWTQRDWASKRLELYSINHRRKSNPSPLEDHQPPAYPGAVYQCRRHPYYPQPVIDNNHLDAVSPGGAARRVYLDSDRGSPQLSVHGQLSCSLRIAIELVLVPTLPNLTVCWTLSSWLDCYCAFNIVSATDFLYLFCKKKLVPYELIFVVLETDKCFKDKSVTFCELEDQYDTNINYLQLNKKSVRLKTSG